MKGWPSKASTDPDVIARWWRIDPNANVGIVTGTASDLVVVDIDPRNGGDETIRELEQLHGPFPETVESLTGGGGRHLIFSTQGHAIASSSGAVGPGVDIRGIGGMFVSPPSLHHSGAFYEWEIEHHPEVLELAAIPTWMLDVIAEGGKRTLGDPFRPGIDPSVVLAGVPEGERNDTVFKFASRHRGFGLDIAEARVLALVTGAACDPPLPEGEVLRTVDNVYGQYESGLTPADGFWYETSSGVPQERFLIHWGNEIENLPSPEWLIDDIMTKGSFVVLYGPAGTGKTFIAHDMAGAVASGQSWQGRDTVQGHVVYVAAEGVGDLGLRHEALRIGRDLDDLPDIGYIAEPVNLYSDIEVNHLIDLIADRKPALIIVDTLARSMDGGDENFAKDMNTVIKNVDRLRHETGAAVMLIHHTGQNTGRERGSSALKGAADVFIKLSGNVTTTATLRCDKMKMAAGFNPISLRFEQKGDSLAVVSRGVRPALKDRERDALMLVSSNSLSHKAWLESFIDAGHGQKATFERALKSLKDKGYVEGATGERVDTYSITDTGREAIGLTGTNGVSGVK